MKTENDLEGIKDKIGELMDAEKLSLEEMREVLSEMSFDISEDKFKKNINRILRNI